MYLSRDHTPGEPRRVLLTTQDEAFAQSASAAFANDASIELLSVGEGIAEAEPKIRIDRCLLYTSDAADD